MNNLLKEFWKSVLLVLFGVALGIACVVTLVTNDSIGWPTFLGFLSFTFLKVGYELLVEAVKPIREKLNEEKIAGTKELRTMFIKHIAVAALMVVLAGGFVAVNFANEKAEELNRQMEQYMGITVNEELVSRFSGFEKSFEDRSWFDKVLFAYWKEYKALKQACNDYVTARAEKITAEISKLEPCTEIRSGLHYAQIEKQLSELMLSEEDTFEKMVLEKIPNYKVLEEYEQQVMRVRERYREVCQKCNGSSGSKECGSCNGKGKILVNWYSYGDWGEVSYSTQKCTTCGGSGKIRKGCSCEYGYIYEYGK